MGQLAHSKRDGQEGNVKMKDMSARPGLGFLDGAKYIDNTFPWLNFGKWVSLHILFFNPPPSKKIEGVQNLTL
jgi:hypothetical protein